MEYSRTEINVAQSANETIENLLSLPLVEHEEKEILRKLQEIVKEFQDWRDANLKLVMSEREVKKLRNLTVMRLAREKEWYENISLNKSLIMNDIILLNYSEFISLKQKTFLIHKYIEEIGTNPYLVIRGQTEELIDYIREIYHYDIYTDVY